MRIQPQNPREISKNPKTPNWVVLTHFQADRVSVVGADSGHHYCTRAGQRGGGRPNDHAGKIFRPAAAGRARIGLAKAAAAANLGRRIFVFSGHFRPTHTSFPTFLNPLNSFMWSLFADSSPFERYDKNKVGRLLDRVFRQPHQPLDQGEGTDMFLVSLAFHLYVVCEFWTLFG